MAYRPHRLLHFWLRWVAECKGLPQALARLPITVTIQVGVALLEQFLSLSPADTYPTCTEEAMLRWEELLGQR